MRISDLTLSYGQNYIFVNSSGTPAENAVKVLSAYAKASASKPNGSVLGITNRISVVLAVGKYDFSTPFILSNNYVDVISSTGQPDVEINNLKITANDVRIKGIYTPNNLIVNSNLTLLVAENIKSITNLFVSDQSVTTTILSGTFINCNSTGPIGDGASCTGTFIGCIGGNYSFGGRSGNADNAIALASGYFLNCKGGNYSFGGGTSDPLGNWAANDLDTASGTFINCIGGSHCFGGMSSASGTFINCSCITGFVHQGVDFRGKAYNCKANNMSFGGHYQGNGGTFSGYAYNCVSGAGSFGNTVLTGKLVNCTMTEGDAGIAGTKNTFTPVTGGGKVAGCVDGTYSNINL